LPSLWGKDSLGRSREAWVAAAITQGEMEVEGLSIK
jgi:hypothetical protein